LIALFKFSSNMSAAECPPPGAQPLPPFALIQPDRVPGSEASLVRPWSRPRRVVLSSRHDACEVCPDTSPQSSLCISVSGRHLNKKRGSGFVLQVIATSPRYRCEVKLTELPCAGTLGPRQCGGMFSQRPDCMILRFLWNATRQQLVTFTFVC
jgi:hypothetical protein